MSMSRKCVCCGKEYEYCPNCAKKEHPGWMVTFCSLECKELFNIVSAYKANRISKETVQAFVAEHNITSTKFTEPIKRVIEETSRKIPEKVVIPQVSVGEVKEPALISETVSAPKEDFIVALDVPSLDAPIVVNPNPPSIIAESKVEAISPIPSEIIAEPVIAVDYTSIGEQPPLANGLAIDNIHQTNNEVIPVHNNRMESQSTPRRRRRRR